MQTLLPTRCSVQGSFCHYHKVSYWTGHQNPQRPCTAGCLRSQFSKLNFITVRQGSDWFLNAFDAVSMHVQYSTALHSKTVPSPLSQPERHLRLVYTSTGSISPFSALNLYSTSNRSTLSEYFNPSALCARSQSSTFLNSLFNGSIRRTVAPSPALNISPQRETT